jgi:hypothetical protein
MKGKTGTTTTATTAEPHGRTPGRPEARQYPPSPGAAPTCTRDATTVMSTATKAVPGPAWGTPEAYVQWQRRLLNNGSPPGEGLREGAKTGKQRDLEGYDKVKR